MKVVTTNLLRCCLSSVLIFSLTIMDAKSAMAADSFIALELEVKENRIDGCTSCGCQIKGELAPGKKSQWWITFGLVRPGEQHGWEAAGASSHCGVGSFQQVEKNFTQTVGSPLVILDISTTATIGLVGEIALDTSLNSQKLKGFSKKGRAEYLDDEQSRPLKFIDDSFQVLPIYTPQEQDSEAFGVYEVLLALRANVLGQQQVGGYGAISLISDVPGAEILLDGGFAGRTKGQDPALLNPVLAGNRQVLVRDFSGREASRQVQVKTGSVAEVSIRVLAPASLDAENDLIPIGNNPQGFEEFWRGIDDAMMVTIPGGEFLMGSPEGVGEPHEHPQHTVNVSTFLIDKTEVSVRQYLQYAEEKGVSIPPDPIWGKKPGYAISFMLWPEAQAYCEWAGGRLPTEAEWEKAARGIDGRIYPWGDNWDATRCNSIAGGLHQPESVGYSRSCSSPYGVLDMSGGVQEWTADRYAKDYYQESPDSNPTGPETGRMHVMRGGGWMSQPTWVRTAYRASRSPTSRNMDHGFRCVIDTGEEK